MSSEVAATSTPGKFSLKDPMTQSALACVGAVYFCMYRWVQADKALAKEIAAHQAAHLVEHAHEEVHHNVSGEHISEPEPEATPPAAASIVAAVVASEPSSSIADWKTGEVTAWLSGLELPQHADAFKAASIDGMMLLTLTDAELHQELGVSSALHRKKITLAIGELRKRYISP